ncbi:hypothetical protein L21SP5_01890 [Salinivirga cyanobacteriivorans]|uniref:Alpha/beta hydrolase family protein n=1 Tax=Salinivirga cyanobacteriivorans TaxID=1307839 RepID=A0A0S2HZG5_9BACT|nr:alpha/beta hydrolase [Salinivirga cyanobacteriivorans]ALO15529.1 hypothetical protein L21SP5_01890 [Salinivirga cyanobacteriivorans]
MKPLKVFLSIRPAKPMENNRFYIRSRFRKIREKHLYFKFIEHKEDKNIIKNVLRLLPSDVNIFLFQLSKKMASLKQKDVLLFIHGYHPIQKSLHLNLLNDLIDKYQNNFGAVIFFSWPNRGLIWKEDDEAAKIGQILAHDYKHLFQNLASVLNESNGHLHLMCQSFGHHILNSFLDHLEHPGKLFDQIFLMAADIPNQSLRISPPGIRVRNRIGRGEPYINYNISYLHEQCNGVHVFYDPYDVILAASQRYYLKAHDRLGKTGPRNHIHELVKAYKYEQYAENMVMGAKIKDNLPNIRILLNVLKNKYNKRHQYFYSNASVVHLVKKALPQVSP